MVIAPTEPPALRALGQTKQFPEQHGSDVVVWAHGRWHGIQRKELGDFVSSVNNRRLGRELAKMDRLGYKLLIIEGEPQWTMDGELMGDGYGRWTYRAHVGFQMSCMTREIMVLTTANLEGTIRLVQEFESYVKKDKHTSLLHTREKPVNVWGDRDNQVSQRHLLMGFDGMGIEKAQRILDWYGSVPLGWKVTAKEIAANVKGVSVKTAQKWIDQLGMVA